SLFIITLRRTSTFGNHAASAVHNLYHYLEISKNVIFSKISADNYLTKIYNEYEDEPLIGIFARTTPVLILRDPDLIKNVLIKDFSVFAHRGLSTFEKVEPSYRNISSL
ncbi:putative cytochrome P450 6a14, partial [Temnothorax longispinosus]